MALFPSKNLNTDKPERAPKNTGNRRVRPDRDDLDLLDPELPLKQRARRRLIGAVFLVLLAILVLPRVFDKKPKVGKPQITVLGGADAPVVQGEKKQDETAFSAAPEPAVAIPETLDPGEKLVSPAPLPLKPSPNKRLAEAAKPAIVSTKKPTPIAAKPVVETAAKKPEKPPVEGAPKPVVKKKVEPPPVESASVTPSANAGGEKKLVVRLGSFSSDQVATHWLAKIRGESLPVYMERKQLADGPRILLRVGPFADRAQAEEAMKKLDALGRPGMLREE